MAPASTSEEERPYFPVYRVGRSFVVSLSLSDNMSQECVWLVQPTAVARTAGDGEENSFLEMRKIREDTLFFDGEREGGRAWWRKQVRRRYQ